MTDELMIEDVLAYCSHLPIAAFAPGDVLIGEGPASNRLYILIGGEVEVLRGDTQVAEIGETGAIFGEMSVLLGIDHTATVRAVSSVSAYRIDDARDFLRSQTEVSFHVARILARRLMDATTYLADFKRQFAHRNDHFGMVDEVLDALIQRQRPAVAGGSELKSDSRL